MLNKILFVLLIILLAIVSVLAVRDYREYRDEQLRQEQVRQSQLAESQALEAQQKANTEAEISGLRSECEKGVIAYGLLADYQKVDISAPSCSVVQ